VKEKLKELFESLEGFNGELITENVLTDMELIFNSAVDVKVASLKEETNEKMIDAADSDLQDYKENLTENLDIYLEDSVNGYLRDNIETLEEHVRLNAYKKIVEGIANVLKENNIDIPVADEDALREVELSNVELKNKINELHSEKRDLEKQVLIAESKAVFVTETADMNDVDVERLSKLMEGSDWDTAEGFRSKLTVMRDNFLGEGEKFSTQKKRFIREDLSNDTYAKDINSMLV